MKEEPYWVCDPLFWRVAAPPVVVALLCGAALVASLVLLFASIR